MNFLVEYGEADDAENEEIGEQGADAGKRCGNERMCFVSHLDENGDAKGCGESVAEKHAAKEHGYVSVSVQRMAKPIQRTDMVEHVCEHEASAEKTEFWVLGHLAMIA